MLSLHHSQENFLRRKLTYRVGGGAQMVMCLPSKSKALSSNTSTTTKKKQNKTQKKLTYFLVFCAYLTIFLLGTYYKKKMMFKNVNLKTFYHAILLKKYISFSQSCFKPYSFKVKHFILLF
jgi:hypothetical protein